MTKQKIDKILLASRALLVQGHCTGAYAKDRSGKPVGLNGSNAVAWDLAGALWRTIASGNDEPESHFRQVWQAVRSHLERPSDEKSHEFCRWLDGKSQTWHLRLLDGMLGLVPIPTGEAKVDISEYI